MRQEQAARPITGNQPGTGTGPGRQHSIAVRAAPPSGHEVVKVYWAKASPASYAGRTKPITNNWQNFTLRRRDGMGGFRAQADGPAEGFFAARGQLQKRHGWRYLS